MSDVDQESEDRRADREALIGQSIADRYVLRALVGHGGMGAVYEAEHLGLGKRVAIKFIDVEFATDERVVARFAREARAMSAIESAHIVTVFDAGTEGGRPYLVMELLRGEDLGQRLRRVHRVPLAEAMHIIAQVLKGLAKAHAAGIVHRDLKPDNVFILKGDTDTNFAKIVDFGVSKIERPRDKTSPLALTGRGTVLGTPFYMCPEQAQAMPDVDARADIYSVGAILFECLTGRPPHTGETYEQIILSICMSDAPDVRAVDPAIPPDVAVFVARALSRERAARFASAEKMLAALHEIAPDEKLRVPLETNSAPETMMSPGVLFPRHGAPASGREKLNETRIAGSGSDAGVPPSSNPKPSIPMTTRSPDGGATIVDLAPPGSSPEPRSGTNAGTGMATDAALSAAGISSRRKRSLATVVITAVVATFMGVAVMLAVISMMDKKSAAGLHGPSGAPSGAPPTITSGLSSASAVPSGLPSTGPSAADSKAPVETVPSAAPSGSVAPPASPTAGGKPASSRPQGGPPKGPKGLDISRDLP